MLEDVVEIALAALGVYLGIGVLAAVLLHARGLRSIDSATVGSGFGSRLVITPGLVALWPLLLRRWLRRETAPAPTESASRRLRGRHAATSAVLAVVLPLAFGAAMLLRPPLVELEIPLAVAVGTETAAPQLVRFSDSPFAELPLHAALRRDEAHWQVELEARADLGHPNLVLYWSPRTSPSSGLADDAVFLGSVWGPAVRRFTIAQGTGHLSLYSLTEKETIASTSLDAWNDAQAGVPRKDER